MTSLQIAREALEDIAERGIVKPGTNQVERGSFTCPVCGHNQQSQGACLNRLCVTWMARSALDAMRTLA